MTRPRSTSQALLPWLLLFGLAWQNPARAESDLLRGTVDSLRTSEEISLQGQALLSGRLLAETYDAAGYELAWTHPEQVQALLAAIRDAQTEGLQPADLHEETVQVFSAPGALGDLAPGERIGAELRLSDALLRYLLQARFGRLDPETVNRQNHRPAIAARPLIEAASSVLDAADKGEALTAAVPRPFYYRNLKDALARYAEMLRLATDLPEIPAGRNLGLGSHDDRVTLVRERLALLGESPERPPESLETFDADLRARVIAFQKRFGLSPDGVVGPATLAALNDPYDPSKLGTIRINLERMRWFSDSLPDDYVLVDVGGFEAHVIRAGKVAWSTRVVVGTQKNQTPSFRDEIEHMVFNPTWTVPRSIEKEIKGVPRGYKRVRSGGQYYLVQQPGPRNALGRVKFIFPNGHSVYMHDTPSRHLFSRASRAYSHGCVRVKDPLKLAEVLLDRPAWDQAEIERIVNTGRTRHVNLDEHLPVVLLYLTAFADANGVPHFRRDIYNRDPALKQALAGTAHPPRLSFADPVAIPAAPPVPAADHTKAPHAQPPKPAPLPGTTLTGESRAPEPENSETDAPDLDATRSEEIAGPVAASE